MWHTVTGETLLYTAILIPVLILGSFIGYNSIKRINEKIFRIIVVVLTAGVAVALML